MKVENHFASDKAQSLLLADGLVGFDQLWSLEASWFEEPNKRRGGWSGVSRYQLHDGTLVFIKRQENHFCRDWRSLFRQIPTFRREFKNILTFQKHGIPTLEPIYFGQRTVHGKVQAILVTKALHGFQSLESPEYQSLSKLELLRRANLVSALGETIKRMHDSHFQHNCLYAKHVFIKINPDLTVEVRLIDLEKAKRSFFRRTAMLRDLGTLHRHTKGWRSSDRLRFLLAYTQECRMSYASRAILAHVLGETREKTAMAREVREIH